MGAKNTFSGGEMIKSTEKTLLQVFLGALAWIFMVKLAIYSDKMWLFWLLLAVLVVALWWVGFRSPKSTQGPPGKAENFLIKLITTLALGFFAGQAYSWKEYGLLCICVIATCVMWLYPMLKGYDERSYQKKQERAVRNIPVRD